MFRIIKIDDDFRAVEYFRKEGVRTKMIKFIRLVVFLLIASMSAFGQTKFLLVVNSDPLGAENQILNLADRYIALVRVSALLDERNLSGMKI